jgi:MFS transporter, Spinster family, sphingosine-1-phosphate transporter
MSRTAYAWALVALLWVVAALNYLDRQVIFSVLPLIKADVHASDVQLGLLATAFLWVYGALSPFGGYLADRLGRKPVILAGLLIWSAVTFLTGHATTYGQLVAARALMGISEAFYLPGALALIADYHSERTRSLATGLHQSGLYTGLILGGAGGGWMGQHYGWRAAFIVLGAIGILYGGVLALALRPPRVEASGTRERRRIDWRRMMASRAFLVLVIANALASISYWCVYTWLPLHLFERFHMSLAQAGFTATFYIQAASFIGIVAGGILADAWRRRQPRARVFTQSIGLAAAGPFLILAASAYSLWLLIPALVLFGLGRGFFDCNLMPVVCEVVDEDVRATAYGVLNCTSCFAGGAIAAAAGALKETVGLGGAIQFTGLLVLVAAALLITIRVRPNQT